jgi:nucleotide-binding universal stress UspA family protein
MLSRVLVPMDGSEMSEQTLRYAFDTTPDAEITVLHVVGEPSGMMAKAVSLALEDDVQAAAEAAAEEVLNRAREIAAEYDREIETDVGWGNPSKVIVRRADGFDAVVIGSHSGKLADRLFVGNVAKTVFHRSPVPVTVVR